MTARTAVISHPYCLDHIQHITKFLCVYVWWLWVQGVGEWQRKIVFYDGYGLGMKGRERGSTYMRDVRSGGMEGKRS